MKKIFFIFMALCLMTSCAVVNPYIRDYNKEAATNGDQRARWNRAATNVRSYYDERAAATIYKSMYTDFAFQLYVSDIHIQNTKGDYVEVSRSRGGNYTLEKHISKYTAGEQIITNGTIPKIITFKSGINGSLYVNVYNCRYYKGTLVPARCLLRLTF